jgi:hypothetical protein
MHLNQMVNALAEYIDSRTAVTTPLTFNTFLRVDKGGNDGTAIAGRYDRPYLTIQAAVTAAALTAGGIVLVGAGIFAENVVIPATVTNLAIIGAGRDTTSIVPAVGIAVAYAGNVPATPLALLTIKDISLTGAAGAGLSVNGTLTDAGAGALALSSELFMDTVRLSSSAGANALVVTVANNVQMYDCITPTADELVFTTVSTVVMNDCTTGKINFAYLSADAVKPSGARGAKSINGCRFAGMAVAEIDTVTCDAACVSSTHITARCLDGVAPVAGTNGTFQFHGYCFGNMTLTFECTVAPREAFICDKSIINGTFSIASVSGAADNACAADFRGSVFHATGGGNISAGDGANLDLRGSTFTQAALVSAGFTRGTINRSTHRQAIALIIGNTDTVFAVPFPDANYSVVYEVSVLATDPITPVAQKNALGFRVTSAAANPVGASFILYHD